MALFSVLSSDANVLLSSVQKYDLFIVGHAAPEQFRREMVDWLKEKYPEVKTPALNPPHQPLSNAGQNALYDDPESWLQFVIERSRWPPPVAGKVRYPAMERPCQGGVWSATAAPREPRVICFQKFASVTYASK